jgi:Fur family ferric uptake transcriptional regulator
MTRQRSVILEELRKVNTHPSADEIYAIVRKRLPRISLGTVYRNLEILAESGDIQKLEPGCSLKRFDGNPIEHSHIRCVRCDRIVDLPMIPDLEIDLERVNTTDFEIIGHRLEFLGVCPICSDKSDRDENRES